MRLAKWSVIAVLSAASCAVAADNTPPHRPGFGPGQGGPGGGSRGGRSEGPDGGRGETRPDGRSSRGGFDRDAWQTARREMSEFFKKYSPIRWEDIEKSAQGSRREGFPSLMMSMGGRFRDLQNLNNSSDPETKKLYQLKIDQIWCEDIEYGLLKRIAEATRLGNTAEVDQYKVELAAYANASVRLRLEERAARLARLEKVLDFEKKAIEKDLARKDELIKDRLAKMETEGPEFFVPPPRPRGEGPGRPESPDAATPTPLLPADGNAPANAAP